MTLGLGQGVSRALPFLLLLAALGGCMDRDPGTPAAAPNPLEATAEPATDAPAAASTSSASASSSLTSDSAPGAPPPTATSPPEPCPAGRSLVDARDDAPGLHQLHAFYVLPNDGVDHAYDTSGAIRRSIAAWESWLEGETDGSRLRLDTCDGVPEVTFLRLAQTAAWMRGQDPYIRDRVEEALHAAGFNDPRKMYLAYYDGSSGWSCGGGAWPPTLVGNVAALYLQGAPSGSPPCNRNPLGASAIEPAYFEFGMLHEVLHTLGLLATCAPHQHNGGHSLDGLLDAPKDLMYQGLFDWTPAVLDIGHDDYYNAGIPGCPDLARSAFLDPLPDRPETPPGWD